MMATAILVEEQPQVDPERLQVGLEATWLLATLAEDLLARFSADDRQVDLDLLAKASLPQIVRLAHVSM